MFFFGSVLLLFIFNIKIVDAAQLLETECISEDDYCYRSDVCVYVLTFQGSANGSCLEVERLVTAVDEVAANIELLGYRIDETENQLDNLDHKQDTNRNIIDQLNETLVVDAEAMRELERRVESLPNNETVADAFVAIRDDVEGLEFRLRIQRESLKERDANLIECHGEVTEARRQVSLQGQLLTEKSAMIDDLDSQLEDERQRTSLQVQQLTERSAVIEDLEGQLENERELVTLLEQRLTEKLTAINDLESQLENERQQSARLVKQVIDKSATIGDLNSKVQNQGLEISTLENEVTTKNARITSLQDQVESLTRKSECYLSWHGGDYRGRVSHTRSGKTCQRWSSQSPHGHKYTRANYRNSGIGDHNYCRNPNGDEEPSPWCYTIHSDTRWEYCNVGSRQSLYECGWECFSHGHGGDYRGEVSHTKSGKTCQRWSRQSPHGHKYTTRNYPHSGLGHHNHCRNPNGDEEPSPWCYTTDPETRWEFCNVGKAGQHCG
ncbi:uncharacterized protein [Ptychodera flava]|uniref:uncharacterized protein n=1 Tax=Ptychodera flava TaxID=63121 RepID=UPI003969C00D